MLSHVEICLSTSGDWGRLSAARLSFYSHIHLEECIRFSVVTSCGHRSCSYYAQSALIASDDVFDVNAAGLMNDYEMISQCPLQTSFPKLFNNNGHR